MRHEMFGLFEIMYNKMFGLFEISLRINLKEKKMQCLIYTQLQSYSVLQYFHAGAHITMYLFIMSALVKVETITRTSARNGEVLLAFLRYCHKRIPNGFRCWIA